MQVVLQRVTTDWFEGHGRFIFLHFDARPPLAYRFPTAEDPNPEHWACFSVLPEVPDAAHLIEAWGESGENDLVDQAVQKINDTYSGQTFILRETNTNGRRSAAFTRAVLEPDVAAPTAPEASPVDPLAPPITPAVPSVAPTLYGTIYALDKLPSVAGPLSLICRIRGVEEAHALKFAVPDASDHTPPNWWFIETFTGISKERVVEGWVQNRNPVLDDALIRLQPVLEADTRVPLKIENGNPVVDLRAWFQQLVSTFLALGHKPFVFLGRPDHVEEHTRDILWAARGEQLYRSSVDAGISDGLPVRVKTIAGMPGVQPLDQETVMRDLLSSVIRFARTGRPPRPTYPPKELLGQVMDVPDLRWPLLDGLVRIPVMRPDGTVLTRPGYDAAARLWYAPEFAIDPVPDKPSTADVEAAKALILTPIAEFPFVDEGARCGALAALVEQILRPMIHGPRPLYVFDAPPTGQGSGKTLLAKTFQTIITGQDPTITAIGKREEEIEKRITVLLRQQNPFVIADNLTAEIKSEALQQLATSERWQARLLNTNDAPILAQNATWVLTLNGARVNRDIARRTVLVRLDAQVDDAFKRSGFAIPNVVKWAQERRSAIIRAILVLARSWVASHCPPDSGLVMGSFEGWAHVVGGVLKHAGFAGLSSTLTAALSRMVDQEELEALMGAWALEFGTAPITAAQIGALAQRHGLYRDHLPAKGSPVQVGRAMREVLAGLIGHTVHGCTIVKAPKLLNGYTVYRLLSVTDRASVADLAHA